tara:strand:- start:3271 stop:3765 length:495 start_codon:yes stop_codon:yes gene_type:complete
MAAEEGEGHHRPPGEAAADFRPCHRQLEVGEGHRCHRREEGHHHLQKAGERPSLCHLLAAGGRHRYWGEEAHRDREEAGHHLLHWGVVGLLRRLAEGRKQGAGLDRQPRRSCPPARFAAKHPLEEQEVVLLRQRVEARLEPLPGRGWLRPPSEPPAEFAGPSRA